MKSVTPKPDSIYTLDGRLSLEVYKASTGDRAHSVFRVIDAAGNEMWSDTAMASVLGREVVRLAEENEQLEEEAGAFRWLKENMPCPDGEPGVIVGTLVAHVHHMQMLLNPRRWDREMCDAWHQALPDLQRAFEGLAATHSTPPAQEGEEPAGTSPPAPRD
jgi:hypothetical protein